MVERLKEAIEKARAARALQGAAGAPVDAGGALSAPEGPDIWDSLPLVAIDPARLVAARIVAADRRSSVHAAFDILRTRLLQLCTENGWKRIAVTSPNKQCGKSLVSLNLAYSLARNTGLRVVLVDLDLRAPSLARSLGVEPPTEIGAYLAGTARLEDTAFRLAPGLAALLGRHRTTDSAELLVSQPAVRAIEDIGRRLNPTIMLVDLPPMLGVDDVQAFLPLADAVLLVAGGGVTRAAEITECEQLLDKGPPLAGLVLNKAEEMESDIYYPYEPA